MLKNIRNIIEFEIASSAFQVGSPAAAVRKIKQTVSLRGVCRGERRSNLACPNEKSPATIDSTPFHKVLLA